MKRHGFLKLPNSWDFSAGARVPIPHERLELSARGGLPFLMSALSFRPEGLPLLMSALSFRPLGAQQWRRLGRCCARRAMQCNLFRDQERPPRSIMAFVAIRCTTIGFLMQRINLVAAFRLRNALH